MTDKPKTKPEADLNEIPALFATIHFRSDKRPDGYTDDEIVDLNKLANANKLSARTVDDDPA